MKQGQQAADNLAKVAEGKVNPKADASNKPELLEAKKPKPEAKPKDKTKIESKQDLVLTPSLPDGPNKPPRKNNEESENSKNKNGHDDKTCEETKDALRKLAISEGKRADLVTELLNKEKSNGRTYGEIVDTVIAGATLTELAMTGYTFWKSLSDEGQKAKVIDMENEMKRLKEQHCKDEQEKQEMRQELNKSKQIQASQEEALNILRSQRDFM